MVLLFTKAKENFNGQSKTAWNSFLLLKHSEHTNLFNQRYFTEPIAVFVPWVEITVIGIALKWYTAFLKHSPGKGFLVKALFLWNR